MIKYQQADQEWLSLKEASRITGKSMTAIRVMIKRDKGIQAKKVMDNNRELWLVHRDTVNKLTNVDRGRLNDQITSADHDDQRSSTSGDQMIAIISELYERQRKEMVQERDQALQGLMMYRYKFEEADRQLKMLPAPVEVVTTKLKEQEAKVQEIEQDRQQKTSALAQAQKILQQAQEVKERYKASIVELKAKLAEEERAREVFRIQWELAQTELKKPWWKKLFGTR